MFSRVYNIDPKVQGGIVMFDSLCHGRGASVSQNLERKVKLCFPCGNSCMENFKYTFNKNIPSAIPSDWYGWMEKNTHTHCFFFIWKIYDHEVSIYQRVRPMHTSKASTYWVMLKQGKIKVKLVRLFPSQQKG